MRFEGKVALITGSGKGMGKATAMRFASEGAAVVLNDVRQDLLDPSEKDIADMGAKVLAINADVSDSRQVNQMVNRAVEEFGGIDILVNNVGVDYGTPGVGLDEKDWDRLMDIDLKSHFLCAQAVVPHMKKRGGGKIVNISSGAGRRVSIVNTYAYVTSKGATISFTRQLAFELAEHGIRVNCVVPGNVATEEGKKDWESWSREKRDALMDLTPMKRMGEPEEIAAATTFLCSDDASYVTGVALDVDGGVLVCGNFW